MWTLHIAMCVLIGQQIRTFTAKVAKFPRKNTRTTPMKTSMFSRRAQLSLATIVAYSAFHGLSLAQLVNGSIIGINFTGRDDNEAGNGGGQVGVLGIDDLAGVVPQQDWTNLSYGTWTGGTNNQLVTTSNLQIDDGFTGTVGSSSASISVQAADSWHTDVRNAVPTPDGNMMDGIIKSGGGNNSPVFNFSGLARANYRVLVYTAQNDGNPGRYALNIGGTTFYGSANNGFNGTYVQNTNMVDGSYPDADYVDASSVAVSSGTLNIGLQHVSGGSGEIGIAGIQLQLLSLLDPYWSGSASTAWNTTGALNWTGSSNVYADGDFAFFQDTDGNGAPVANYTVDVQVGGVAPGSVTVNSANNYTFGGGAIGGTGSLTKSGSSTLILNSANTYAGGTNLNGGTIRLGVNNALPSSGNVTFQSGATIDLNGRNQTLGAVSGVGGGVTNSSGSASVITVASGSLGGFGAGGITQDNGVISLVKTTPGTLVVNNANTFTGGTTISDGTLTVTNNGSLGAGAVTIGNGATLDFGGQAGLFLGGVTGNGNTGTANPNTYVVSSPAPLANSNVNNGSLPTAIPFDTTAVYTGYINNTTGSNQTWAFAESFDDFVQIKVNGQTILQDGTWNNAVRAAAVLNPGLNSFELRLGQGGGGVGPTNSSWMSGTNLGVGVDYDNTDGAPIGFSVTTPGVGSNYQALPTDSGNGNVFVSSVVDNFANNIVVTGNATLNVGYSIGGAGSVNVGQIDIGANTLNITGQAGLATLTNGSITATGTNFTAGNATFNTATGMTFNPGSITGNLGNTVTKTGGGTLLLDQAQSYSGGTVVTGGKLIVTNATGSATGAGNVTLQNGAIIGGTGTVSGNVTAAGAGGLAPGFNGVGQLNIGGTLSLGTGSTLNYDLGAPGNPGVDSDYAIIGSTFTLGGNITINLNAVGGFVVPGQYDLVSAPSVVTTGVTYTFNGTGLAAGLTYNVINTGTILRIDVNSPTVTWTGATNGVWDTSTPNWTPAPLTYANGNTVIFDDTGSNTGNMTISGSVAPFSTTFNNTTLKTYSITGVIAGAGGITKTGDGTVILAGANTFTGTVSNTGGGTLQFGDGVTNNGAVSNNITNDATLVFANPNAQTYGSVISGSGGLVKSGAGNLTLTSAQTYNGDTVINGGTLQVNVGSAPGTLTGSGSITINNGGTLLLGAVDALGYINHTATNGININVGGTLSVVAFARNSNDRDINSVGGTLTSQGTGENGGTYTMRDANGALYNFTSSGVTPSTFSAQDIGLEGTATFNVTAGGGGASSDLNVTGNMKNILSGNGVLRKIGDGKMVLANSNNTYTGGTLIEGGILQLGGGGTTGSLAPGAVTNDASLVFNRSNTLSVSNAISGTGTVVQSGSGLTALTGANTYTGGTIVNTGTLRAFNAGAFGTGTVTLNGGVLSLAGGNINGFNDFTLNNGAVVDNDVLTLTTQVNQQRRSAFAPGVFSNTAGFTANFIYDPTAGGADGFTFTLQNQADTALGTDGGGLGYEGIGSSGAVAFNIWSGAGGGVGTRFVQNGARPGNSAYESVSPVALAGGNPIQVTLTYDGTLNELTQVLTDTTNPGDTHTRTYSGVDFEALLGGQSGFIGFTGGTGGESNLQQISEFSFASATTSDFDNDVTVSAGVTAALTLEASLSGNAATINDLNVLAGANLTISGGSLTMDSLSIGAPAFSGGDGKASSAVVPEPGTVGLLLVGALGVLARRRRQQA